MADAKRDGNYVPTLLAVSSADGSTPVTLYADPTTHRLYVDLPSSSGTVTSVSVVTANGFAGTVATSTTTPEITLTTGITGVLKGNGTAISAASDGTDYLSSTTGITVSQGTGQTLGTTTNRLTKLWATDITCTNAIAGSVTGNAATVTNLTFASEKSLTVNGTTTLGLNAVTLDNSGGFIAVASKTLTVNNILTLAGTDSTTMTFPSTSASIARTDAAQTFTGTQTFSQVICSSNAITASGNAATVPVTSKVNTVTNNSAATLTITMTTTNAVDGQTVIVRILDSSAAAQTISWVNTEDSTVTAPTTSNGSTTLPLTVGFQYNNATSKWRCIAKA